MVKIERWEEDYRRMTTSLGLAFISSWMQMLREHPQRLLSSSHSLMASTWPFSQDSFYQTSQEPLQTYVPAVEHLQQKASPSFTKVTAKSWYYSSVPTLLATFNMTLIILTSHMDITTMVTACLEQGTWVKWGSVSLTTWPGNEKRCCSVAQLCLTLLRPHGLQHTRLPCPSLFPRVCSNSCSLSQWCHPTISSSVVPFTLSQHQGLFQVNWLFASRGQNIGASTSASVLPMNIQGWFPLGLIGLIYLQPKGLSRVFSSATVLFPCKITGLLAEEGEWLQRRQNPRLPHLSLFLTLSLPVTLPCKRHLQTCRAGCCFSEARKKIPCLLKTNGADSFSFPLAWNSSQPYWAGLGGWHQPPPSL